uniref:Uncharacterized protein n=1 Tax=Pristionchus pacificus TaxID=54126 RepID=A0A2A6B399_PRIPA|eukprot:PDM60333.1 hypothetical protein PRIPAC_54158 [Pristionchus pacificus]
MQPNIQQASCAVGTTETAQETRQAMLDAIERLDGQLIQIINNRELNNCSGEKNKAIFDLSTNLGKISTHILDGGIKDIMDSSLSAFQETWPKSDPNYCDQFVDQKETK